jgi:choline dehydrogenase-like flavoprotein
MHVDPKQGVVDEHCRVHGVGNLYVAGSSVFPTGGYANPTLTLCALAIRLADRVKREMQSAVTLAPTKRSTEEDW